MKHLAVIGGPTASGKTSLSIELAQRLGAEIISADSRQFYRGMDIGTAKVRPEERKLVPHHFIDHCDPGNLYSAGHFEEEAMAFLSTYFQKNDWCIAVGGSGLYLQALCEGFDPLPRGGKALRDQLNHRLETSGLEALAAELTERDPEFAARCDLNNPQRVLRALEVMEITGLPMSQQQKMEPAQRPFQIHAIALDPPRPELYRRIDERVLQMIDDGLVEEVKRLLPYRSFNALKTVGYAEIIDHLDGKMTLETAVEKIQQHTRNYAKRQRTWFKNKGKYHLLEKYPVEDVYKQLLDGAYV